MREDSRQPDRQSALAANVEETLLLSRNCAQTSFAVLQREFALDGGPVLKALTPFPGLALRGETCGAVTGCLMAIGLVHGRDALDDRTTYLASLKPARAFCRRFEDAHGSTACAALLESKLGRGFNLADRNQSLEYVAAGGPHVCAAVVTSAVQMAADIIESTRARADTRSVPSHRLRRLRWHLTTFAAKVYVGMTRVTRRFTG